MKVPMLDLKAQLETIREDLKSAIDDVIESTRYIGGPMVERCEEEIAKYVGTKYAVGVSSGTDALLVSLMALNIGYGDIVITTDYSFFATAGVISRAGAKPVFVDIDPDTYNISPEHLENWFARNKDDIKKVKAIIPVHLYGQCADMDSILSIAERYEIPVIEDSAQAIGAKYPSKDGVKKAGQMGLLGCFSFFPSKNLGAIGDGGVVVTDDEELYQRIKSLRNHGEEVRYFHSFVGGNFRLDAIQAAAILVKIPHLERWHEMRRENAKYYDMNLKIDGVKTPYPKYGRDFHIYNQYVISVRDRRDELLDFLNENEIGCKVYYPVPFHRQKCFSHLAYSDSEFPNSVYASQHTIAIPVYPELTRQMQDYVIEKIGEFFT
ncbi:transcriptional regulator [bacterium]|nr:MAG: transcriptional regulator [bacterium]